MAKQTTTIPIASIILDEDIYPRKGIDPKRVGIFAENIRDGFNFEPIEVEPAPDKSGKYRLLDGAYRWSAYKSTGAAETEAVIKNLDGEDPLLYAAQKAIGPRQLTEDETRETARRAYNKNTSLSSADIGKAIGRARRTVDSYIADLRAATQIGSRHQDISYEPPWHPAGQDRKEIGRAPTDNIQPFTKNASNGKSGK